VPDETLSLDQLYQAIEQHLQQHLPGVQTVAAWPNIENHIPLPAVFLEMSEIEPGVDIGTGETTMVCKFEARIIVDPLQSDHHRQVVQLATQLIVLLRTQNWGLPVECAEFIQAVQDWTRPELDGYTVWLVEWNQTIYLGAEEWPWPDEPPGTLLIGVSPDIGPGSREQYVAPEHLE
jgi:hypothetical protein